MQEFIKSLLSGKKDKTNIIDQLYTVPKKDKNGDNTTFTHVSPNYFQYLDTLYLPNDKGYIYALVITDQGSRLVDIEPLKDRKSSDIVNALNTIYKRKILMKPKVIVTDAGSEFKKDFSTALKTMEIGHKTVKSGRHRSVALVERKNQTIGKIIHKILLHTELGSGNASSQWVSYCKDLVKLINEEVKNREKNIDEKPIDKQTITYDPKHKLKMFNVGDNVRVALDNPKDINGKPLHGKFRSSDIRFDPKVRTIKYVLMEPEEPVMYLLDGNVKPLLVETTAYTYNQLQKVSSNEKTIIEPILQEDENRFEIKTIKERKKVGRSYQYLVKWKAKENNLTWEKRKNLVIDLGVAYMDKLDKKFDLKEGISRTVK
jgi:hypothetical protein